MKSAHFSETVGLKGGMLLLFAEISTLVATPQSCRARHI